MRERFGPRNAWGALRAWWLARQPASSRLTLTHRNVYILPTRAGWALGVTLLALLAGSVNYQLNLGYLLTFLVTGCALAALLATHATLRGLSLTLEPAAPGWAGRPLPLTVQVSAPAGRRRTAVRLAVALPGEAQALPGPHVKRLVQPQQGADGGAPAEALADVEAGESARLTLWVLPARHGLLPLPALRIDTVYPLGLFRAWAVWRPAGQLRVAPAPADDAPPESARLRQAPPPAADAPPTHNAAAAAATAAASPLEPHDEGLRPWRRGDRLSAVAWKRSAQRDQPLSREHAPLPAAAAPPPHRPQAHRQAPPQPPRPRDARDTLFLLAVIAWVLAPLAPVLPAWSSTLAAAVLAWRGRIAWVGGPLPATPWRVGLLAAALAGTLWSHHTLVGREAGVTLLAALMALKTLELRARRDAFAVFFLGFFILLTQFFRSQSLLTALAIGVGVLGLLAALANAHQPVGRPPLARSVALAGGLMLRALPVMLVLFLLFPRLPPLWGLPGEGLGGRTGLSGHLEVGDITRLALDDSPALRVRFDEGPPARPHLYFRGPVLASFDGRTWLPLYPDPVAASLAPEAAGPTGVAYQVTLEPSRHPWLPVLDIALAPPVLEPGTAGAARAGAGPLRTPESQWLMTRPLTDGLRYRARSHLGAPQGPLDRISQVPLEYRELPPGFNPRTLQLATDLMRASSAPAEDKAALVQAALALLRGGGFRYTLEPRPAGLHTADAFWFDQREGFCEHIASAFAVLMRGMDIPARIVTGYQGGEPEAGTGQWLVRQSDAHAWVEVWLQGRGWVRVDPTGAIAPDRLGQLQRLAPPPGLVAGAVAALTPGLAERFRAGWANVEGVWREQVLTFTQARQLDWLARLGWQRPSARDLVTLLGVLLAGAALAGLALAALAARSSWRPGRGAEPLLRRLAQTRSRLARAGLVLAEGSTPRQMAQASLDRFGDSAKPLAQWLHQLEAERYGVPSSRRATAGALARQWKQLAWPR